MSPVAGVAALELLCRRNYIPVEISNVLYRPIDRSSNEQQPHVAVRVIGSDEAQLWADISARGWAQEHPELRDFVLQIGAISATRQSSVCFVPEVDGDAGAAGVLCIHGGVALFGGAATIPELRRRGLQAALLEQRMRYAFEHRCDTAMMVAEAGSNSQRNAERKGFRIAYTRIKWRLAH